MAVGGHGICMGYGVDQASGYIARLDERRESASQTFHNDLPSHTAPSTSPAPAIPTSTDLYSEITVLPN